MSRGFGGGSFDSGSSSGSSYSGGSSSNNWDNNDNYYGSSGGGGESNIFTKILLSVIGVVLLVYFFSEIKPMLATPIVSTTVRTRLSHTNNDEILAQIQQENSQSESMAEYCFEKTGVVVNLVAVQYVYSDAPPAGYSTQVASNLYVDKYGRFCRCMGFSLVTSSGNVRLAKNVTEYDVRSMCRQIYNYLYDDEYHMIVLNMQNFVGWDYAYYIGEDATKVFDKEAQGILDKIILKNGSSSSLSKSVEETTDVIMSGGPLKSVRLWIVIGIVLILAIVAIANIKKARREKKEKEFLDSLE